MGVAAELDVLMNRFRIAGRELYNNFFLVPDPYQNDGWTFEARFRRVEQILFEKLVGEPASLPKCDYGLVQQNILVELSSERAPIMINREIDSGYWDYPMKEITRTAQLLFIEFFDWDRLGYRDNQYARVQILHFSLAPEVGGRQALIESQYVKFVHRP